MDKRDWLLRGGTIGTGIGLIAIFITLLPIDSLGSWSTGDSLVFGLLSSVAGILWEINSRQQRRSAAEDRTSRLMVALENSDLHADTLVSLCQHAGEIREMSLPEHVMEEVRSEISEFSQRLGRLAVEKELQVNNEDDLMHFVGICTKSAEEYIWATSAADGVDEEFWESTQGTDYLQAQKLKVAEGIPIRRIFFTGSRVLNEAVVKLMAQQERDGIEVGARMRSPGMEDFIIFDGSVAILTELSPAGRGVEGGSLDFHPDHIEKRIEAFDLWWEPAKREWETIKTKAGLQGDVQT